MERLAPTRSTRDPGARPRRGHLDRLVHRPVVVRALGLLAVASSVVYLTSDAIEAVQGGFSDVQLALTLGAELSIPAVVLGLAAWQLPVLERYGQIAAGAYAYAYVVFTATVVYALVDDTPDYQALRDDLGALMAAHGAVMVAAGLAFGVATLRARLLPGWSAGALMVGVVLVAATQGAGDPLPLLAAAVRAAGFAGMGAALLAGRPTADRR